MKKLYLILSLFLALTGRQAAHAQDTTGCNAVFTVNISRIQVTLRALDVTPGVQHNWNFGDGTIGTTDSVLTVHDYNQSGNYLVTQVVIDSVHHCQDSSTQIVTINLNSDDVCNVFIQFTSDSAHQLYSFQANPVFSGGSNLMISWTINDTLISDTAAYGALLTRYLPNGPYTVCASLVLTVQNDTVCSSQSCVTIDPLDSVSTQPPPDTCTISCTAVPNSHTPNQYVFSLINGQRYDSISWTIIGGADSLFAGPYHDASFTYTFADTGYYDVYVTAEALPGCSVLNGQVIHIDSIAKGSGNNTTSYPNPATSQVTMNVTLDSYTAVDIRIFNSMGGLVLTRSVDGYPGVNQITLPIANLPTGVYYSELRYGETTLRSKFQKL